MATLRQDVWLTAEPRRRGLRLGPFGDAAARLLVCPGPAARLDDAPLVTLLDGLAERLEVVAYEQEAGAIADEPETRRWVEFLEHQWGRGIPLVVLGLGLGAPAALALAETDGVRAVALLNPSLPSMPRVEEAAPGGHRDKPMLLVTSRANAGLSSEALDVLGARWPRLDVILLPGDETAGMMAPWPAVVAEWAVWAVRAR
jgi:hypothetical protein